MLLKKAISVFSIAVLVSALATGCSSNPKDYNGTYKNTDESYANGKSKIVIAGTKFKDDKATGTCSCVNVYGINKKYFDKSLNFSATDGKVKITDPDNANTYWTGTFDADNYTITFKNYDYKK
jgi:hypothetical protein